ncbi:hypothetical protein GCM10023314_11870 [Algibacter agarivorans]|uniref:Uncharacterized protein n=1 Tax=Algibacter agarivorans TaxID=1109741 RepID=A0ABP9GFJ6_9FLAO
MIRLNLNPSLLKSLNFNKKDNTLEIEFKHHIKTTECMDIPISIVKDYVSSMKEKGVSVINEDCHVNLKIVHSNFIAS